MIGAIIGDIVGSRFEFGPVPQKSFELFTPDCSYTAGFMNGFRRISPIL